MVRCCFDDAVGGVAVMVLGVPAYLSHYYEATQGPFRNLSDLSLAQAERVMDQIRQNPNLFASRRPPDYMRIRRMLEDRVRHLFICKGGHPVRQRPHYMVLGSCPWLMEWYQEGRELRIPLDDFPDDIVSFTYGDTFPAMRYQDGKAYRGKVFTRQELPALIAKFGLPQEWNADCRAGPDRYIEAQIWDDRPLRQFLRGEKR